ncbi:unnamed protein product [Chrysoparadoxa australica]
MRFDALALATLFMMQSVRLCRSFLNQVSPCSCSRGRLRPLPSAINTVRHKSALSSSQDEGAEPYYITTPIYYVNDKPHIGHAYTTLACDVIARFMRLDGRDVKFLTGTDEHGQKVQESAEKNGKAPQEFCDEMSANFSELLQTMDFSNDQFVRTTEAAHKQAAQALWEKLEANGAIYLGTYAGWYSVRDEAFYNDSELVDGKAPTGAEVEWVEKEPSYFFKLSEYEQPLLDWYQSHPEFIAPKTRFNEVLSFVKGGLKDLSISRTSFEWGVPVPGDGGEGHVMYVWIDALTNYLSALGYPNDPDGEVAKFWPADLHVVGKDILRFHAVYWPAFLMAAGLEPPKKIFAHGWWTKDGQKISKSLGNVIDPFQLVDQYGVDQTRYFLMSGVTFGSDGDFSHSSMVFKVNSNLANELGNLAQRTLTMAFKNCEACIPEPGSLTPADSELLAAARACVNTCRPLVAKSQQLHKYCDAVLHVVGLANKYVDDMAPWGLKVKDPQRMATVLWCLLETIRHIAILYQPLVPGSATRMLDQLEVSSSSNSFICLIGNQPMQADNSEHLPQGRRTVRHANPLTSAPLRRISCPQKKEEENH